MKQLVVTLVLILVFHQVAVSQEVGSPEFVFDKVERMYSTTDTIRISYNLDTLGILHSNFGGCGGGEVFVVTCHTDETLMQTSPPNCDYLLMEYNCLREGVFQTRLFSPGIYSISFYVNYPHELDVLEKDRFTQTITTQQFEVIQAEE